MKHIGKYEIRGLLGRGGWGAVYKVREPETGRIVALKLLKPTDLLEAVLGMDEIERRFLDEMQVITSLRHPNIVSILDHGMDDQGRPFFVMEYYCDNLGQLVGEHYEGYSRTRLLDVTHVCSWGEQILSGVGGMHQAGFLHLDLKPFNVMLTPLEEVKLIDFGLSRLRNERREEPRSMKVGTPFYTAPEQENDPDKADERSDLYSIGVLLWRMLTGHLPAENPAQRQQPSSLNTSLCPMADGSETAFDRFLHKSIATAQSERFQTARDMHTALRAACSEWRSGMDRACALLEEELFAQPPDSSALPLRTAPVKVAPANTTEIFPMNALGQPSHYFRNDYREIEREHVHDAAAGLVWQKKGTDRGLTLGEAEEYIQHLNTTNHHGRNDWRLPTVEELLSLLRVPKSTGEYCTDPIFDQSGTRFWSCDTKSYTAAWYANAAMGFVSWQDFTCRFHVRAVRTAGSDS